MIAHALAPNHSKYCNTLGDDGDYVEQLTFLLFLKIAEEQSLAPFNKPSQMSVSFGG